MIVAQSLVEGRELVIGIFRLVQKIQRLALAAVAKKKVCFLCQGFRQRESACRKVLLRKAALERKVREVESGLTRVSLQLVGELSQVSERLARCFYGVVGRLQRREKLIQQRILFYVRRQHKIVNDSPRFGIEHPRVFARVVQRRRRVRADKRGHRDELLSLEQAKEVRFRHAETGSVALELCVSVELRETFIQPERKAAKIHPQYRMSVLMVERMVLIRRGTRCVRPHERKVHIRAS